MPQKLLDANGLPVTSCTPPAMLCPTPDGITAPTPRPYPMPSRALLTAPDPSVRDVYCLREPVNGLWAYYAVMSNGMLLCEPRPAELGLDTAFVVNGLYDELDERDPVPAPTRHLRLVCGDRLASVSAVAQPVLSLLAVLLV